MSKHVSMYVDPYSRPPDHETAAIIDRVIKEVRPYSMVPDNGIAYTIRLTLDTIRSGIPGDLVECGTWLGGCSFAMLLAQRYAFGEIRRPVWMYDSFQGMSPPTAEDGDHGQNWHQRARSGAPDPCHQNYCVAPYEQVLATTKALGFTKHAAIFRGWLHETLPKRKPEQIAVLRIDCDWYEPVKCVLEELAPGVATGGAILLDDYYAWEGCVLATHEYLAKHKLPWRIKSVPNFNGAWMIKGPETW